MLLHFNISPKMTSFYYPGVTKDGKALSQEEIEQGMLNINQYLKTQENPKR